MRFVALEQWLRQNRHGRISWCILTLGVNGQQFLMDRDALGLLEQGLLQDFLCLKVATVSHVDIGLGDRIRVLRRVQLAG